MKRETNLKVGLILFVNVKKITPSIAKKKEGKIRAFNREREREREKRYYGKYSPDSIYS